MQHPIADLPNVAAAWHMRHLNFNIPYAILTFGVVKHYSERKREAVAVINASYFSCSMSHFKGSGLSLLNSGAKTYSTVLSKAK